jgi:ribonuclease HI
MRYSRSMIGATVVNGWSDGSCAWDGNGGPGGWAAILVVDGRETILSGCAARTTSLRMEMLGALATIKAAPCGRPLILTVDCQMMMRGATEWMMTWKTRGWRKVKGGRLANADIWSQFDEVLLMHGNVAWHWVPRRSDAMSKRVDRIAVAVRKSVQTSQAPYDVRGGEDHTAELYGTRDGRSTRKPSRVG